MREFAITYPQLMNQAAACGLDDADRRRLHRGFAIAQRLVDGIYRRYGTPFLCHLTRTASIVMTETRRMDVILAALVHAAYFLHYFQGSRRRGPRRGDRLFLRRELGEAVESRVRRYPDFPWNTEEALDRHRARIDAIPAEDRDLLLMKLANELEDHLDAAAVYAPPRQSLPRHLRFGERYVVLAQALGHPRLAADLEEALEICRHTEVSGELISNRPGSYELRSRLWQASPLERAGSALRRYRSSR